MPHKIFITGATGFIGGEVLFALLNQSTNDYTISALVRNEEQAKKMKELGVTPVIGTLDDSDLLFQMAKSSDAVVHCASAEHLPAIQSLVHGLKAKNDERAVFLHTSGIGVLSHDPVTTVPFSDMDLERIRSIPPDLTQKKNDNWVMKNMEGMTAAIIAPASVHGVARGPFRKTNPMGQVNSLTKASVARRKAGYLGTENTTWSNVNICDLGDLYVLVLSGLLNGTADHGKNGGYYFGATHEHTWKKVAEKLATVLHERGLVDSMDASPFEQQYIDQYLYGSHAKHAFIHDSRAVADRSKKLGWRPSRPDIYETIEQEVGHWIEIGELRNN